MLLDLKVLNGEISPKFDKYNNIYTVKVHNDVEKLDLDFKLEDDYNINVLDNNSLIDGENIITLEVYNDKSTNKYTLIVNKEYAKQVFNYTEQVLEKEELPEYVTPLIIGTCFILIIISYLIIFRHKKVSH